MPKRTLQGVVVSDKQAKTVVVRVDRRFTHPEMKKTIRRSKKYHAHDETNQYSVGDMVWIEERRPISKLKCWEVVRGEKKHKAHKARCPFRRRAPPPSEPHHDSDANQP